MNVYQSMQECFIQSVLSVALEKYKPESFVCHKNGQSTTSPSEYK